MPIIATFAGIVIRMYFLESEHVRLIFIVSTSSEQLSTSGHCKFLTASSQPRSTA